MSGSLFGDVISEDEAPVRGAILPDLSECEGAVTEDELEALLHVVVAMGRSAKVWPSPFAGVNKSSIPVLARAISSVYGFDEDEEAPEEDQTPTPGGAGGGGGGAQGGAGGSKTPRDLRLGSMVSLSTGSVGVLGWCWDESS